MEIRRAFHATTFRAARLIADGDGLDPDMSERFEHVFLFESFALALAFIERYPGNFRDTGPVVLEIDTTGLSLTADPQVPHLPGAWRYDGLISNDLILSERSVGRGQVGQARGS